MKSGMDLERRQRDILAAIIRQYVASGVPVGSKALTEQLPEALSPATIRNVMAQLETTGFLEQPHVSAGRVPTDKAYRFFVDRMAGQVRLGEALEQHILKSLGADLSRDEGSGEHLMQDLLGKASHVLSEISNSIGMVLGPAPQEKVLEHVKFVRLPERRVLAVIVSKPDLIENKVVRPDEDFSQDELDRAANYLNEEFRGWSVGAVRIEIFQRLEDLRAVCSRLMSSVAALFSSGALSGDESGPLFVDGTTRILDRPEFENARQLKNLLRTFEEKAKLVRILGACLQSPNSGVRVLIGSENTASEMQQCTVIMAPFHYRRRAVGALGVVGPTRIEYERAIRAVEYVAHLCSKLLSIN